MAAETKRSSIVESSVRHTINQAASERGQRHNPHMMQEKGPVCSMEGSEPAEAGLVECREFIEKTLE
jgi:hypothetical protein